VTRVEIVIDELILRGVPPERAHDVAASLEAQLATLAADGPIPRARAEASRRLPEVETNIDGLGRSVAGAVWGGIA
jgi:hypothetical protein